MKKLFTLSMVISITFCVFAQAPQKMSYQCVVRNASGVLVTNQSVGIKISILQGTSTGTVVYQETYSPDPQTNANGLVSIEIGGGTPITGIFSNINWAAGPYFLKTETDPAGGTNYTIAGTSQLLSVPYAFYAKTAENGFSGNYIDLTNKPTLFDGNYNSLLNLPALFNGQYSNLTGKPTLATVATSGSYADLINQPIIPTTTSQLTNNSGFLTSEVQALSISNDTISLSNGGFVKLPKSAWSLLGNAGTVPGTNFIGTTDAKDFVIKTNNTEKMRISSTGKVGIGINNGTFPLEVCVPSTSGSQMNLKLTNLTLGIGYGVGILFAPDDAAIAKMGIFVERRGSWGLSTMHFLSRTSPDYASADLSNSVMAITSNGNVGIGTTNPGAKLEVNGQVKITGGAPGAGKVLTSDAAGLAVWGTPAYVPVHYIGESYGGGIVFYVYDNGQHGLIAATADQSTGIRWYAGTYTITNAKADGVGAGKANTAIIIANQGYGDGAYYATSLCNEYQVTVGGVTYGDWYLPSEFELSLLNLQKSVVGGFANGYYWTSTEFGTNAAWYQPFPNGAPYWDNKATACYVRAIRAF